MSMPRIARFVLPGALAAGCFALAWQVAPYLSGNAPDLTPSGRIVIAVASGEPAPEAQGLPQVPIRLASVQSFSATVERPIFAPNRRAPKVLAAAEAPVPSLPFDLALKGIIFSSDAKLAVVSSGIGGEPIWLAEGDEYRGWKLAELTAMEAAFQQNSAVKRLVLDYDGEGGATDLAAPSIGPQTRGYLRPLRAQPKAVAGSTVIRAGRQPAPATKSN